MPGNLVWESSGDHRETGSSTIPPPRHWSTKAKSANERGRRVSRRRILAVKKWWLLLEDGSWDLKEVCIPAIWPSS
ncbi:Hypothetical predicted protein [Olea europaea subsp. europaea]|uniref:Uncharacterized protein n=1 Tax=Olea europaea subsp. europaea TaxID=158383 RepID=A0A8S0T777_OLEEU|nr:Hypothetical predicted protein [Olea europaea subsp. europaea]